MKEDRVEWRPHRRKPSPWLDMTSAAEMLFVGIVFALRLLASQVTTIDVAYSDFLQLVEARQVQDLVVTPTRITGTLKMPGTKRGTRSSHTTASTAIQRIGLATLGEPADPMGLPGFEPWRGAPCSDATARLVDEEIRGVLNDAHARVTATLQAQRAPLERIARLLLEREVLDHELLQKAIEGQPVPGTALDVDQRREAVRDYAEGAVSRCGPS